MGERVDSGAFVTTDVSTTTVGVKVSEVISVRRNLHRDARYWDRALGRMRIAKARHSTHSDFPWYGPTPRPKEILVPQDLGGPSPHLTWKELCCRDGTPYPLEWRGERAPRLAREFEAIRVLCGHRPLAVASGFRSSSWNFAIGGAENSQHVLGRALDIKPPQGMSIEEFWNIIYRYARTKDSKIRGIGRYPSWVHIDIRPQARLSVWTGSGVS